MSSRAQWVIRTHQRLMSLQDSWKGLWRECAEFTKPRKSVLASLEAGDRSRTGQRVYDGTPEQALDIMAAGLHAGLTHPGMKWFSLGLGGRKAEISQDMARWLEEVEDRLYDAINHSNFNAEIHETYVDLGCFGTACLYLEENLDRDRYGSPLRFNTRNVGEVAIAENRQGRVDTVLRSFRMTAGQAMEQWGEQCGLAIERTAATSPDRELEFIHAVMPRLERDPWKAGASNMPYASIYVDVAGENVIAESGYEEFPYLTPRWSRTAGEFYGRSPAMKALADIKMLNEMEKDNIMAGQLKNRPPLLVPDDGFVGPVRMIPGALNYYRSGKRESITPLVSGADLAFSLDMAERKTRQIRASFLVDMFLMLDEGPNMTATEIMERRQEKLLMLGPVLGRLQSELLDPLIMRAFSILRRSGLVPEPPEEFREDRLAIHYAGPLTMAQRAGEVMAIQKAYGVARTIAMARPEVLDNLDHDEAVRLVFQRLDAPMTVLKPREQVREEREARKQEAMANLLGPALAGSIDALKHLGIENPKDMMGRDEDGNPTFSIDPKVIQGLMRLFREQEQDGKAGPS